MNSASKNNPRIPERIPVILIFGPTAIGKSRLLYSLFGRRCEIINADSQQVYRHLDIGTAKPGKDERERITYHLIDFLDPKDQFNTGEFVKQADTLIRHMFENRIIPVIAGGTGFYFRNFIYGLPAAPPSDPLVREKLKAITKTEGLPSLYAQLAEIDPAYASKIEKNDSLRIIRALEVFEISGQPVSSFRIIDVERECFEMYKIGLTMDRDRLYRQIDERVEKMFSDGLVDEVRILAGKGYSFSDPGLKGIGYHEFSLMQSGCFSYAEIKEQIKTNSRHYAKRQITFFKSFRNVHWFDADDREGIKKGIADFLGACPAVDFPIDKVFLV